MAFGAPPLHNERRVIYRQDCDRYHFLELLGEATERFGIRIRDYVPGRATTCPQRVGYGSRLNN